MNMAGFFETFWQDLRYGVRVLAKTPGVTAVALLSLALGIGATTSIFSVVYGVLISPYPYSRPGEIWAPGIQNAKNPRDGRGVYKISEYLRLKEVPAFSTTMATLPESRLLTGGRAPESFTTIQVTANAFQFLAVDPILGRTILPTDMKSGGEPEPVIVLTYKAWHRLFDSRPDALGKTLVLNDVPYTVIGVMPSRFGWWTDDGGWVAMPLDPRDPRQIFPIVRLAAGISPAIAAQQFQSLLNELAKAAPADFPKEGFVAKLNNYLDITVASGEMRSSLMLLCGAVGFLLLIACANVANLQLARATSRAREIALRMSVGAGQGRVLRQLLTESVLLSLAGGILGVVLAIAIAHIVDLLMPEYYKPNEARITTNQYVLAFSVAVSVLTGILFGLAPALQCSRLDLVETLKDSTKGSGTGAKGRRMRNALVIIEVALSVVLLVGAGLTIRGFVNLQNTATGFQPERIVMVDLTLPPKRYTTWEQRVAFSQNLLERVTTIPGALSAAIGNGGLPFGGPRSAYTIDGHPQATDEPIILGLISADYPRTLGIPLLRGRALSRQDIARADHVALINQAAARLWPAGEDPIGRHVQLPLLEKPGRALTPPGTPTGSVTIVGILADTRNRGRRSPPAPQVFLPYTLVAPTDRSLAVRAQGDPLRLFNSVREQVQQLDKDLPISRPVTMDEVLGDESRQPRFNMALFTFFGALGLILSTVGIFSVLSYNVVRRTHEIGVRMALGAERGDVLALMLGSGARLVLIGIGIGVAASLLLGRLLRSEVFSVPVTDPVSLIGVVVLLSAAAFLACLLPARKAARLEPTVALRHE